PPPRVRDRPRDLLPRLAALCPLPRSDLPQPRPGPAGRRRRDHVRRLPRPGRPGVPQRPRTRDGDGDLRRHHRHRRGDRPAGRRPADRRFRLAVGLPAQRADRAGGDRRHLLEAGRVPRSQRDQDRLGRAGDLLGRAVPAGAGAGPRQRRGLGQGPDRLALRRRGRAAGGARPFCLALSPAAALRLWPSAAIERRFPEPMLPLSLFRRRAFTGVQLAAFAVSGSMFALFLYLTLYLQSFLGLPRVEAGVRSLPITVASFIVAPFAGMALAKVQARYLMSAGLALTGVGLALMTGLDMSSEWTALLAGFIISGVGVGLLNPVIADVALSVVPKERSGMAAGINDTFRQVGIAVGIATWGAIFLGVGASKTQEVAGGAVSGGQARGLVEAASSGQLGQALNGVPHGSQEIVRNAAQQGF